jgi:hypothetical protein
MLRFPLYKASNVANASFMEGRLDELFSIIAAIVDNIFLGISRLN